MCVHKLFYLVDYILPVLDQIESAAAVICVFCEGEGCCSSPQIQLPQCLSDCHLSLGTAVQVLNANPQTHECINCIHSPLYIQFTIHVEGSTGKEGRTICITQLRWVAFVFLHQLWLCLPKVSK